MLSNIPDHTIAEGPRQHTPEAYPPLERQAPSGGALDIEDHEARARKTKPVEKNCGRRAERDLGRTCSCTAPGPTFNVPALRPARHGNARKTSLGGGCVKVLGGSGVKA